MQLMLWENMAVELKKYVYLCAIFGTYYFMFFCFFIFMQIGKYQFLLGRITFFLYILFIFLSTLFILSFFLRVVFSEIVGFCRLAENLIYMCLYEMSRFLQ